MKPASYPEIKKYVDGIRLIDTHEHLPQEPERLQQKVDFLATFFSHYASVDLRSAGMTEEELIKIRNPDIPLEERWDVFQPSWEKTENTGYARAVAIAARDLYGVEELNFNTVKTLSDRIKEKNTEGLYKWVLKEKAGIDLSINDAPLYDVDTDFFAPVRRFSEFLFTRDRTALRELGKQVGKPIHTFKDMVSALRAEFDKTQGKIFGVKIGLAYTRSIYFQKRTFAEAEEAFNKIYKTRRFRTFDTPEIWKMVPEPIANDSLHIIQDYLIHLMIQEAIQRNLPIQIHTGLQEGNENIVANSHPDLLTNLFMEYKEAKFDVFHGGWPYSEELGALAKNFPNVYIDMCWMHIISPSRSRSALSDWLDEVPANKIMGFGGDYLFVEGAYGHSVLARENIAHVLAQKVDDGVYTVDQAKKYARWLLRENPERLFLNR
jgi:hypothetical protein